MKFAFTNGIILDGTENMKPQKDHVILVDGEKINGIVPSDSDYSGYVVIDLAGKYIMPGLVNLHVHLPANGKPKKKQTDARKLVALVKKYKLLQKYIFNLCSTAAKTQLMSGVTTIRTVGGVFDFDTKVRDAIKTGKATGPRIIASNMAVSVPNGHMAGSLGYIATSADEAAEYVEIIAKDNPDIIKLMITGGVLDAKEKGEPGALKMPPEYIKSACEKAHSLGYMVAAHVESSEGVRVALEGGVDTIEHGAMPDDEIIELFKKNKSADICTISPALPYALFDREISHVSETDQFNGNVVFEGIIVCAKKCLEEGIPVGLGTDTGCPYITHYDMWRELNYFCKFCGVSHEISLYSATLGNARIAKIDNITGSIEPGKSADMIVCDGNPLENFARLRKLDMVVSQGKIINKPKIKKFANVERELDKFI